MSNRYWTSNAIVGALSAITVVVVGASVVSTLSLPFFTVTGLLSWLALVGVTLISSRFTVLVTTSGGVSQNKKSMADAVVLLAIMMYAVPPADAAGPATLLAAINGVLSTRSLPNRRQALVATINSILATFISASCYAY